ncbi:substrate-binding periplasmic protein [Pseudoalteromonas fenneropenaei]|uniref:Substrate-binding periplasmic protein n=1 Tax=Pseudoalteromonas fenneropenaei TaxID=1737459 RepID=A0ABV7CN25_9GAMM
MTLRILLLLALLSYGIGALSLENPSEVTFPPLKIAASGFVPPYVIQSRDSGYQLELIRAALKTQGIADIEFVYLSNKRAEQALSSGLVDAAVNLPPSFEGKVYATEPVLEYQNVAITLSSSNLAIQNFYDLKGKSVVAFQNAAAFLGADYRLMVKQLKSYEEVVNQFAQVELLMKGWTDVIIMERRVFDYYAFEYAKKHEMQKVDYHILFNSAPRPMFFASNTLRDVFNLGLEEIKRSGEYQAILANNGVIYAQRTD